MRYIIPNLYLLNQCYDLLAEDISLFPGLEKKDLKKRLNEGIKKRELIAALDKDRLVGLLLFSRENNELVYFEVDPEYRGQHIAIELFNFMIALLPQDADIKVISFREGEPEGEKALSFYKKLGFKPEKQIYRNMKPTQEYIRKSKNSK